MDFSLNQINKSTELRYDRVFFMKKHSLKKNRVHSIVLENIYFQV